MPELQPARMLMVPVGATVVTVALRNAVVVGFPSAAHKVRERSPFLPDFYGFLLPPPQ